jgi:hypothetical protein
LELADGVKLYRSSTVPDVEVVDDPDHVLVVDVSGATLVERLRDGVGIGQDVLDLSDYAGLVPREFVVCSDWSRCPAISTAASSTLGSAGSPGTGWSPVASPAGSPWFGAVSSLTVPPRWKLPDWATIVPATTQSEIVRKLVEL